MHAPLPDGPRPVYTVAGLCGLTRLRIARRPFLTDAWLGPVLAANRGSLVRLELAGCPSLTDAALLHLLAATGGGAAEQPCVELDATAGAAHQQLRSSCEEVGSSCEGAGSPGLPQRGSLPPSPQSLEHSGPPQQDEERLLQRQRQPVRAPPPLEHLQLVCCDRIRGSSLRHLGRLRSLRLGGCPSVEEAAVQVGLPRLACSVLFAADALSVATGLGCGRLC